MRYFFNLQDGSCLADDEGEELPDDAAAIAVAQTIAADMSRNNPLAKEWTVFVRDETGRLVTKIRCLSGDLSRADQPG